jgi:serine/threonine protein phosphatase PrpC
MEDRGVNHANAEIALERYTAGQAPGVISDSDEDCSGYFGIYDGHDGNQASEYIHKVLHFEIMKHRLFETDIEAAMIETCKVVDETLLAKFRKEDVHCGSTALGAFIRKGRLTVFSVGDCRAVLCRSNEPVEMNDPHRPLKLEETLRIERANGWVTTERVINLLQKRVDLTDPEIADIVGLNIEADTSYDVGRVIGDVSVSRAFGAVNAISQSSFLDCLACL